MNEWVSTICGIHLTGNKPSAERKTYFSVTRRQKLRSRQTLDRIRSSVLMGRLKLLVRIMTTWRSIFIQLWI